MNENEIQEFFATLGIEAASDSEIKSVVVSVANQVTKCIKAVKNGKNDGSIALPVKLEGNYKNGKEIEKEIVDAYAAFYDQVDKIARKRVSSGSVKGKNKSKYFTIEEYKQELDTLEKLAIKFKNVSKSKTSNETIKTARDNVNNVLTEMRYTARTSARDKINEIKDKSVTRLDKTKTRYAKQVSRAQNQQQSKETEVKQLQQKQKDLTDAKSVLEQIQNDPKSVDMNKKQIKQITKETVEVYGSLEEAINTLNDDYDHITTSLETAQQELRSISSHRNDLLKEATTVFENINKELTRLGVNLSEAGVVLEEEVRKVNRNHEDIVQDQKTIKGYAIGGGRASQATPGADTHLGMREAHSFTGAYLDEDRIKKTAYRGEFADQNNYLLQVLASEAATKEQSKRSLRRYFVDTADFDSELEKVRADDKLKGTRKELPKSEVLDGQIKLVSHETAKRQGGVIHGREDTSIDDVKIAMKALKELIDERYGTALGDFKYMQIGIQTLFNRYSKHIGRFEVTDGEYEKGEHQNHEEAVTFQKEALAEMKETLRSNSALEKFMSSMMSAQTLSELNDPKGAAQVSEDAYGYLEELMGIKKTLKQVADNTRKTRTEEKGKNNQLTKLINDKGNTKQDKKSDAIVAAIESQKEQDVSLAATTHQQASTQNKTSKEISQITETNANDGFDAERNASKLINTNEAILDETKKNNSSTKTETSEAPKKKRGRPRKTKTEKPETSVTEPPIIIETPEIPQTSFMEKSNITASAFNLSIWTNLKNAFDDLTGVTKKYKDILSATADEQDDLAAERIIAYGLNNGRNPTDTGDKANIRRALELFRTNKQSIVDNPELLQEIKMTKGVTLDTTEVTKQLNKILTGKQMRNAQMGGSPLRQILGSLTGFVGMPSIEKSRAQAEGMNQIMGNITDALQDVVIAIQTKETELSGLEKKGDIKIGEDGAILEGTSAAKKTAVDLAEHKLVLETILADMTTFDKIIKKSGGDYGRILKQFTFSSPVLRENNKLIRNMRAGLDKNGKAMKFQSRTAEMMNYAFQLMSRHIAQIGKNLLMAINPITLIKKAFNLFSSYDPKWQRTMNVVVYNLREVIRPIVEWLAQKLVNIIGFFDIISQTIQSYLGNKPISLFDQENAKKTKELYEDMYDTAASFDELHDVGSSVSENNPDNLLGEIYKPTVSEEWKKLAKDIGELFGGIIKGDLGFSDVMTRIIRIGANGAKLLWTDYIKPFITDTIWPTIKDNWLEILAWMAGAFAGWTFLKWAGGKLAGALFSGLTGTTILANLGNGLKTIVGASGKTFEKVLSLTPFGAGIVMGIRDLFGNGVGLLDTLFNFANTAEIVGEAKAIGMIIGKALTTAVGATFTISQLVRGEKTAKDKMIYNNMLMENGGQEDDKKSIVGTVVGTTLGSALTGALTGLGLGGLPGAAIGAAIGSIAAIISTTLVPAADAGKVSIDSMNQALQSTAYYEGTIKGLKSETTDLQTLIDLLTQSYEANKNKVIEEGLNLGITRARMEELTASVEKGTFTTDMLTDNEIALSDSLVTLAEKQDTMKDRTEKLEAAKLKLAKAEMDLAILQDVEAGKYELAAARIEVATASELYTAEEAMAKRKQIYALGGEECREAMLSIVDKDVVNEIDKNLKDVDRTIQEHQSAWQKIKDVLAEIFTLGQIDTWTFNTETKASKAIRIQSNAVGTNYVEADGLQYLHQGEAIIPKKYNQPYQPPKNMSTEEMRYMSQMMSTMRSLDNTMKQGITVNGQFTQRGSDLVAVVNKTRAQAGAELISNPAYAR